MNIFPTHSDLFASIAAKAPAIQSWKPRALAHDEWFDRDYRRIYAWRIETLAKLRSDAAMLASAKLYYSTRPSEFIQHWTDTYDPRKSPTHEKSELRGPKRMPFVFFDRQVDVIAFFHEMRQTGENGLIEKCRDAGVTWLACAYSVWSWLFIPSDTIGWGSRKQELVDKIGDPSSIFEKLRMIIRGLHDVFLPEGLRERDHLKSMNLVNPENNSAIIGEIGDNIGRGGRTSMYFKDESAHYERPEKIQAALDDNTHVQIDISSVNGIGNVFHRRRKAGYVWSPGAEIPSGYVRVLIVDWREHPEKTQDWYDKRKATAEREGLQHIFAQEVDRDYAAAMSNRIIDTAWIYAAVDVHLKSPLFRVTIPNVWMAGLDVADEGIDRNAQALRQWIILRSVAEWGERDPGSTARRSIGMLRDDSRVPNGIKVQYDSIGVGSNVKSEYNRLLDTGDLKRGEIIYVPWNAGASVVEPYAFIIPNDDNSPTNNDFFQNMKAQAWWSLRSRFYKTWRHVTHSDIYPVDELISLDSAGIGALLPQLIEELSQPVSKKSASLRTMVDKQPDGSKSPNLGDCTVMCYFPAPEEATAAVGGYSG
jgi:phage terminase large subunit